MAFPPEVKEELIGILGENVDEWFETRPHLLAVLNQKRVTIAIYKTLENDTMYQSVREQIAAAEDESEWLPILKDTVETLIPFIVAALL